MKCLLLADERLDLLATLEPILKHWGYRVLAATDIAQANTFLAESAPALLIIGGNLLGTELQLASSSLPVLALEHPGTVENSARAEMTLGVPVDIFALFSFIQKRVEQHPRRNLRLRLHLPGMYCARGEDYVLADVLSLSMAGLFFRSPLRLARGDRITAVFPLLGYGKELEVAGTVLYVVEPTPQNNYMQGFGLGFTSLDNDQTTLLERFIEQSFLDEVAACQPGVGAFSVDQLQR
jgi:Tfp pilus assembly protein PilZ